MSSPARFLLSFIYYSKLMTSCHVSCPILYNKIAAKKTPDVVKVPVEFTAH